CDVCPTVFDPAQRDSDGDGRGDRCPPLVGPAWGAASGQPSSEYGTSVASAGDVNGDGYDDVVVGAYAWANGQPDEGAAFVYLGSSVGLSAAPVWSAESNLASAAFGTSVASAGDVNGDGYDDVIVGAPSYTNGQWHEGAVYVYLGSAAGLSAAPSLVLESNLAGIQFGTSVASAGDVDGDGYDDVVVGAPVYDGARGAVALYLGSAAGLSAVPAWTATSNQAGSYFGSSVASAGDVDGDGRDDVVVSTPSYDDGEVDEGAAFLYVGTPAGLSVAPVWTATSNQSRARFGQSVASAGDVNGDGYDDVVVGAGSFSLLAGGEGAVFLYFGSAAGLSLTPDWFVTSGHGDENAYDIGAHLGTSVGSAGDVNGDGYDDVVAGAPYYDEHGQWKEGAVFVYLGSPTGPSTSPAWTWESSQVDALLGWSVATAGDVNGDGLADVVVGAPRAQNGEGGAVLFLGNLVP
ncbi:MAG: FG-GAP repeat protein, partial [Alphaproteobacteria bacterium]|nr:FG-GAP repeat protein [Alphaproteobacteria bacterium]